MTTARRLLPAALAALLLAGFYSWPRIRPAPWLEGMDADRNGYLSRAEWREFHERHPIVYGGHDERGVIPEDYDREFDRVDCNRNDELDACEYKQLRWNLRWCGSDLKPRGLKALRDCLFE